MHDGIRNFLDDHEDFIRAAYGSSHNHQNWSGGYLDHVLACLGLAHETYVALNAVHPLPFALDSAMLVLFFHDIEKIWAYSGGPPTKFDKDDWYDEILPSRYSIFFSEEERSALMYVHGEGDDYRKDTRVMNELGAFCHVIDVMSARIYHDKKVSDFKWNL